MQDKKPQMRLIPAGYDKFDIEAERQGDHMKRANKVGGPPPKSRSSRNRVRQKVA